MESAEIQKLEDQAAKAQAKADEIKAKLRKKRRAEKQVLQRKLGAKLMATTDISSIDDLVAYQARVQADLSDLRDLEEDLRDFAAGVKLVTRPDGSKSWQIGNLNSWMTWVLAYRQKPSK